MSRDIAISAFDIAKRYSLGERSGGYDLLTERLGRRRREIDQRTFWALEDVGFDVARGETFGVIGHNGAGKSTLLKILSRVTPPTRGGIDINGRIGALLEVGTGFHPELTGAENVFLNGALLGMRRREVASRFDEIVEFAEVERFIDTPVKRYSSGMYLRLAFAVAAHLEPEILVVDEVLSVGDLAFQEKCLGRMQTVAGEGRTVLFVSHNLGAVAQLCGRAIMLERGRKVAEGPTDDVIEHYVRSVRTHASMDLGARDDRSGTGRLRFTGLGLRADGKPADSPATGQDVELLLHYETADAHPLRNVNMAVSVQTILGETMLHLYTVTRGEILRELPPTGTVRCRIPRLPLPAGQYALTLWADIGGGGEILDWVQRAAELTVIDGDFYGSGRTGLPSHPAVLVEHGWDLASEVVG